MEEEKYGRKVKLEYLVITPTDNKKLKFSVWKIEFHITSRYRFIHFLTILTFPIDEYMPLTIWRGIPYETGT